MKRKNTSVESEPLKRARLDSSSNKIEQSTPNEGRRATNETAPEITSPQQPSDPAQLKPQRKPRRKAKAQAKDSSTEAAIKHTPQPSKRREIIRKLAPPRPFPTIPSSVSGSGPKSVHKEGRNLICITRQTSLAAYLSRCKKVLVEDGYQILHLHGMGAAIPHLLTLSVSLPPILPFPKDEIQIEVRTGTIEVMDEVIPEAEDEDISLRTRGKAGVSVILKLRGGGEIVPVGAQPADGVTGLSGIAEKKGIIIVQEQEQQDGVMKENDSL